MTRIMRPSLIIGLLISTLLIGFLSNRIDWHVVWSAFQELDAYRLQLGVIALVTVINLGIRALRWHFIFPRADRPGVLACFLASCTGNFANFLLPARGGDILRAVIIGRRLPHPATSQVLATVGLEKVLDGLMLLLMLMVSALWLSPPMWYHHLTIAAGALFGGTLALLILLQYRRLRVVAQIEALFCALRLPEVGIRMAGICRGIFAGLCAVASARHLAGVLLLTAITWVVEAVVIQGLAGTMHIVLTIHGAMVVSAIIGLGMAVPAAPGALGTYELAGQTALGLFGIGAGQAIAFTLLLHAWALLITAGLGLISMGIEAATVRTTPAEIHPDKNANIEAGEQLCKTL